MYTPVAKYAKMIAIETEDISSQTMILRGIVHNYTCSRFKCNSEVYIFLDFQGPNKHEAPWESGWSLDIGD